jgi:hypothetical protein
MSVFSYLVTSHCPRLSLDNLVVQRTRNLALHRHAIHIFLGNVHLHITWREDIYADDGSYM